MSVVERRRKEKQERVDCILSAALCVFARRGLKDATVHDIAQAAELGKGTLYYYFSSKEVLLEALVVTTADHYFKGLLKKVNPESHLLEICDQIVDNLLDNYRANPKLFKILYWVLAETELKLGRAKKAFMDKHFSWLDELEVVISGCLEAHNVPAKPFINFIGTHTHGIVLAAVAGRPLCKIREESACAFKAFFTLQNHKS